LGRIAAASGMRLHRFLTTEPQGESVVFAPEQARQIQRVLRLRPGDRVVAFDGIAPVDLVVELDSVEHGRVVDRCPQPPEPRTQLTVYPALLQRDKFESVLQKLAELGVATIVPVLTARGLVREPPDEARLRRWSAILQEATEQCGRGTLTALRPTLKFEDAVAQATGEGAVLLAYEGERRQSVGEALRDAGNTIAIFVGPEGGYTPEEAQSASATGAKLIALGPRVLRTETASPVLAALVLYERGDLSSWHQP
jgi:16S rRNA (uracil1498-N3)-methyltransferase